MTRKNPRAISGKPLKRVSDASRARAHDAGAKVLLVQPSWHERHGVFDVARIATWACHANEAEKAFAQLCLQESELLKVPLDPTGKSRLIADPEVVNATYMPGVNCILHLYLAFEHLTSDVINFVLRPENDKEADDREVQELSAKLHFVVTKVLDGQLLSHPGYHAQTGVLKEIRDAIVHPKARNQYNATDREWAGVPTAWFFAGLFKKPLTDSFQLLEEVVRQWELAKPVHQKPAHLVDVKRGIAYGHDVKLPPRSS